MRRSSIISLNIILFVVSLVLYFIYHNSQGYDNVMLLICVLIMVVSTVSFFSRKETIIELKNNYFKAVYFFILGYIIVHFQCYIDLLLGNISENNSWFFGNANIIIKVSYISLLGLISFYLGYLTYNGYIKSKNKIRKTKYTYPLGYLIALTYPVLYLFFRTVGLEYILGGYGSVGIEVGGIGAYSQLILQLLFYAIMILNYINAKTKGVKYTAREYFLSYNLFFYFTFGAYCIMVMLSGDRGPLISLGLAYVLIYSFLAIKKIKLRQFFLMIVIAMFVVTTLGVARSFSKDGYSFKEKITMALSNGEKKRYESFSPNTLELAGSVRTLHYSVDYVPERHPHLNGLFQTKYLISSIPFISGFVSPLFDSHYKYKGSSSFVTWIEQGDYPSSGAGSTCVADLYLDFGVIGVILGLFLFGLFLRWSEFQLFSRDSISLFSFIICFYATVMSFYIGRSMILFQLKGAVWLFMIVYIYHYIFKRNVKE